MKYINKKTLLIVILLILGVLSIALRLLPHAPNFAPIGALALFAGIYATRKIWLVVPLAALFISDAFIGFYDWKIMAVVYGSFLAYALIGRLVKNHKSFSAILGGTFAGALIFFITTNFAVWAGSSWYAHSWEGLVFCYTMALPFFRNSLFGDLFYVVIYVGAYEAAVRYLPSILKLEMTRRFAIVK